MKSIPVGAVPTSRASRPTAVPLGLPKVAGLLGLVALILMAACLSNAATQTKIDGARVLQHVEKIIGFGPHPPGSPAQKEVQNYIEEQLVSYGLAVERHDFHPVTPRGRLDMTNLWGILPGEQDGVIILASHYDSKYFPFPFVGANDSGSSSALLLELARVLAGDNVTRHTLWFVFFDGEEALMEWTTADSLYGSREFVRLLKRRSLLHRVEALILLDMVGERDLSFRKDANSSEWLNRIIWQRADEMGHADVFQTEGLTAVEDDHIPFAREGIPVVDIIDLEYAHWHLGSDTLDKLSADNLGIVGNVVLTSLDPISNYLEEIR